jgi:site-specific DNA recombinase
MSAAAIYARYSSDLQREASIEDQNRICRERAAKEGWSVHQCYSDRGISGASLIRPGIQKLLQDAQAGRFGIVLAESLDRLSRDQEDIAHIFKRINFAGARIVTLSGRDQRTSYRPERDVGALYLKDLADKTLPRPPRPRLGRKIRRREQLWLRCRARTRAGWSSGHGRAQNQCITGGSRPPHLRGIRRWRVAAGDCKAVERRRRAWPVRQGMGTITIHGNRQRGTGILNNELYIGRFVWNRLRYIKDPEAGKRVSRLNPESEWIGLRRIQPISPSTLPLSLPLPGRPNRSANT